MQRKAFYRLIVLVIMMILTASTSTRLYHSGRAAAAPPLAGRPVSARPGNAFPFFIQLQRFFSDGARDPRQFSQDLASFLEAAVENKPIQLQTRYATRQGLTLELAPSDSRPITIQVYPATPAKPVESTRTVIIPVTAPDTAQVEPAEKQPTFPIRAAFYYPWFEEAWKQRGIYPYTNFHPELGTYSSRDETILQEHIAMMQYAHIDAGIASWWGQGSQTDEKTNGLFAAAAGTNFHWALYYEEEGQGNPSADQIQNDLEYIRDQYAQNAHYLRVDGKFVIFVYSDSGDRCGMVDRWKKANTVDAYIVLRIFPGYTNCTSQPDGWHQYSPAHATVDVANSSFGISPGFWLKGQGMRLRRDPGRWEKNVRDMIASREPWQLILTFNEWGEGTAVEPASEWASSTIYGQYLDILHDNP